MITARPLLMAGPMVRSTIDGIKTQTRRIVKPQPFLDAMGNFCSPGKKGQHSCWGQRIDGAPCTRDFVKSRCPYGVPGDLLYVKENHYITDDGHNEYAVFSADESKVREHAATLKRIKGTIPENIWQKHAKLRPSIHMPRWASRLTLEITDVRVERLQDISEEDAEAEGIEYAIRPFGDWKLIPGIWDFEGLVNDGEQRCDPPPAIKYAYLWNSINAKAGTRWADNPWVWVLTFAVHHANVDAVLAQRAEVAA